MWLALAIGAASASEFYRAELSDGTLSFTDSPTHSGYERFAVDGRTIPAPPRVSVRRFPMLDNWDDYFIDASYRTGVPAELLKAVCLAESAMNPSAESWAGAMGLMQLMPGTAADLGVTDPWDPWQNVDGGARYLSQMFGLFSDVRRTLAAYHAGPANVKKYGGIPPFETTQDYVAKVSALYEYFREERPVQRDTGTP